MIFHLKDDVCYSENGVDFKKISILPFKSFYGEPFKLEEVNLCERSFKVHDDYTISFYDSVVYDLYLSPYTSEKEILNRSYIDDKRYDVCFGNGVYILIGQNTLILKSNDGKNFKYINEKSRKGIRKLFEDEIEISKIVFGNNRFVGCGEKIISSNDGENWEIQDVNDDFGFSEFITSIKNSFFVLDYSGIYKSETGLEWSLVYPNKKNLELSKLIYGNGRFVVLTHNNIVVTSIDSEKWFTHQFDQDIRNIVYCFGYFFLFGDSDNVLVSRDCLTWKDVKIPQEIDLLNNYCFGESHLFLYSYDTIIKTDNGIDWELIFEDYDGYYRNMIFYDGEYILYTDKNVFKSKNSNEWDKINKYFESYDLKIL